MLAALYAVAMAVLLLYGANLLWMALRHVRAERLRAGRVPEPGEAPEMAEWPRVTIQLPLFNEACVAERLIDAVAAMDYPRRLLDVQVLDDSTDETRALVARRVAHWQRRGLDVVHVHRVDRTGYKAGALANGLRLAGGEFVAVFDADFLPPPDFLRRMLPHFDAGDVGMVQARWGHLNADDSLLTRLQAFGLDAHFAIEQRVRSQAGCFLNFNGTAGIWRRACIGDAGGWQADTLTEDLDLSYRAQLRGWRFRYVHDVEVPAELPADMGALRSQQFRWAKGAAETAIKILPRLWRAPLPLHVRVEGTLHLTAHVVFPFVLLAMLVHAPLLALHGAGAGPGDAYFALMGVGLVGFAGFFLAQLFAQRDLYPDWPRRLGLFPVFMAGTMGLALSNARGMAQAVRGHRTPFVRTPKHAASGPGAAEGWWRARYAAHALPGIVWAELALALYAVAGLAVPVGYGLWSAAPFQALAALGFGLVGWASVRHARRARPGG